MLERIVRAIALGCVIRPVTPVCAVSAAILACVDCVVVLWCMYLMILKTPYSLVYPSCIRVASRTVKSRQES